MIKIFAEFHGAKRCPCIRYRLNEIDIAPSEITEIDSTPYLRRMVLTFDCQIPSGSNRLCLIQEDKTDDDLMMIDDHTIDHFVEIKELQLDGVNLESVLFQANPIFEHHMPQSWVDMMTQRGYDIPKIFKRTTQLRLNGVWTIEFQQPIWKWHAEKLLS